MSPAEPLPSLPIADPEPSPLELGARLLVAGFPRPVEETRAPTPVAAPVVDGPPRELGALLVARGLITADDLRRARDDASGLGLALPDYLARIGTIDARDLAAARAYCAHMGLAGPLPRGAPGLDALARRVPVTTALAERALPWALIGGRMLVATSRPERRDALRAALPQGLGPCLFACVTDAALDARLHEVHGPTLAREAECRVPEADSCRRLIARRGASLLALALCALLAGVVAFPAEALGLATVLGLMVLLANLGLRAAAWVALRRPPPVAEVAPPSLPRPPPTIALLVPLHDEPGIVPALLRRLEALDYPRALLDICLVVEAGDLRTRAALDAVDLPPWIRVIPVPDGRPRTKPRAMNYALRFARGEIVGVYDAEDAPAPDQLRRVAARFAEASPDLACLQGRLDYYNPERNWIARCFTIEYATWFRLVLPGIVRMGLVMPLGGTTVFFRRTALQAVDAWDAHNVTEDADLGVRLARRGYRVEMIDTTTLEEANAHPVAWTKQRSRWLKGYVLTWIVHCRHPLRLLRELGLRRALGLHLLLGGAVLNAVLLPALWSTIVLAFGVWHPILEWLPSGGAAILGWFFAAMMLLNMALTRSACAAPHHRHLRRWILSMEAYYPLATLAMAKAGLELLLRPFHWDKTAHGRFGGSGSGDAEVNAMHVGIRNTRDGLPESRA